MQPEHILLLTVAATSTLLSLTALLNVAVTATAASASEDINAPAAASRMKCGNRYHQDDEYKHSRVVHFSLNLLSVSENSIDPVRKSKRI